MAGKEAGMYAVSVRIRIAAVEARKVVLVYGWPMVKLWCLCVQVRLSFVGRTTRFCIRRSVLL